MRTLITPYLEAKTKHPVDEFNWVKNPSIQKILDVLVNILVNDYVRAVKENPTLFSDASQGDTKCE